MKKILFLLSLMTILNSCQIEKIVIVEKYDPVDWYEDRIYPIKDTNSCAVGFLKINDTTKVFYARDRRCRVVSEYALGDTIDVILKLR
jgi:hypothetical protein